MYDELDRLILDAVTRDKNPLHDPAVNREAQRIAAETGREAFRVIDGRLQAMRRKGRIKWMAKAHAPGGLGGWRVVVA
jgi:hypothetical protein